MFSQREESVAGTTPSSGLALCLSGGGFRAALFHLGALRRLNELGILSKVTHVASVSGGSILAAHLATQIRDWPTPGTVIEGWQKRVEAPFRRFVKHNIRTGPIIQRFLLPWNWFRPGTQALALEARYKKDLTPLLLTELPVHPKFTFCATDMVNGVSWIFERDRVGSYLAKYLRPAPAWPLAKAVAASSCFPPIFSPMPIDVPPDAKVTPRRRKKLAGMTVSDGGLYDNLGLQPVERVNTVLVSDGGAPFVASVPRGLFGRVKAYVDICGKQAGAIRKRLLIAQFVDNQRNGAYWGVGSAVSRYSSDALAGYSKGLASGVIAQIRTDMDAFSDAEIDVLINHGYLLANIAIQVHAPFLVIQDVGKAEPPFPEWMDEAKVRRTLKGSRERRWLGRF